MLVRQLLRLLCLCIRRNDQNSLNAYNQNFVAHSRKILEAGIVQEDLLSSIFKIHETACGSEQVKETVSPLVYASLQLVSQVFNDLP